MISDRVYQTQFPPLVELGKLANQQQNCISLGQGAPYYYPPKEIFSELNTELEQGLIHRYTTDPGIESLRIAISEKMQQDQKISVTSDQIVLTPGANQAFYNVLLTITDPGDEIILLTPYYFNHYMACTSLNLQPITVPLHNDFTLDITAIGSKISSRTKAIVLVNPGNPTGVVHHLDEIKQLVDLASQHNILLIADETYEYFVYKGVHTAVGSLTNEVISISSFSKTFGIPGWRLGYYSGPTDIIEQSIKVQDTIGICAPHITQYLGLKLIRARETIIAGFVKLMETNHRIATDLLAEVSWLEETPASGAYYLFPKQITGKNTEKLVRELIIDFGIYIVPGQGFGKEWQNYCRLSFANVDTEDLKEAFSRLRSYS